MQQGRSSDAIGAPISFLYQWYAPRRETAKGRWENMSPSIGHCASKNSADNRRGVAAAAIPTYCGTRHVGLNDDMGEGLRFISLIPAESFLAPFQKVG